MKKLQALIVRSLVWIILFAGPLALLVASFNLLTAPARITRTVGSIGITGGSTYRLSSSIGTSNSTLTLSSFKEPVSNIKYTMSYLNATVAYGTIDPNTSSSEFVSFSGITQNSNGSATLTGVSRGLTRTPAGVSCTASSTLAQPHSGQSIFILSDSPCLFAEIAFKGNDETITGQWTFTTFPITPSNATSSTSIAGILQSATGAQAAAGTRTGSTGALLALTSSISTSTYNAGSAANVIPVTDGSGQLDAGFLTSVTPTGSLMAYASSTAPTGWLVANGQAVSRTTYARLYAVIGTTYGAGNGATTFNLPDVSGKSVVMASSTQVAVQGLDRATMGAIGTTTSHIQTIGELAAHSHTQNYFPSNGSGGTANGLAQAGAGGGLSSVHTWMDTMTTTGSSQAFNTLDPYIVMYYIIKY